MRGLLFGLAVVCLAAAPARDAETKFSEGLLKWYPEIRKDLAGSSEDRFFRVFLKVATPHWENADFAERKTPVADEDIATLAKLMAEKGYKGMGKGALLAVVMTCQGKMEEVTMPSGEKRMVSWRNPIPSAASAIAPLLKEKDLPLRCAVVEALGDMRAVAYVKEIVPFLKEGNVQMRTAAIWSIGNMASAAESGELDKFMKDIVFLLDDGDFGVRHFALGALGQMQTKGLLPLLEEKDTRVRCSAIWAIGRLQVREHAEKLVPLLHDADGAIRAMAAITLVELSRTARVKEADNLDQILGDIKEQTSRWNEERRNAASAALKELTKSW